MKLYIQVENGQCINHPAFEDNLIQAFGQIPVNWEPFDRIERPATSVYEVLESEQSVYQKVDGRWKDVWSVRPMTQAEKDAVQKVVKDFWATQEQASNWSAWTYDEATNSYVPPIPRPEPDQAKLDQGIFTFWSGADNNWKDTPTRPQGNYKFNFLAWTWVEITV